jgi:hypothetical protein
MELLTPPTTALVVAPRSRLGCLAGTLRVLAWVISFAFLTVTTTGFSSEPVGKEYQVKAAFLYNFAKFVEWPAHRFEEASSPIVIGVFGGNPFGGELERLTRDRTINGRPIVVRVIQSASAARGTHLLFFSADADNRFPDLREALRAAGTLTVGESDGFGRHGGMINFVPEGDKLRFEINIGETSGAGLKMSAQLQKLAKNVRR